MWTRWVDEIDRYSARIFHVHYDDIRADVYKRIQSEGLGYDGFATIQQERVPCAGRPHSITCLLA
jgi:sugar phosphate isomerase/epimerase